MRRIHNDALRQQLSTESGYPNQFTHDPTDQSHLVFSPEATAIVHEGAPATDLFYLARGRAKLTQTLANGQIILVDFFTAPCFIGEMELIEHHPNYTFTVTALSDCWCLALDSLALRNQLLADAQFLQNLCRYFVHKNYRNIQTATRNQRFTLAQRLADFILLTAHDTLYHEKHTQVADYLGVTYRHLLYVLAQFVQQGILTKRPGGGYLITDRPALTALAHEITTLG